MFATLLKNFSGLAIGALLETQIPAYLPQAAKADPTQFAGEIYDVGANFPYLIRNLRNSPMNYRYHSTLITEGAEWKSTFIKKGSIQSLSDKATKISEPFKYHTFSLLKIPSLQNNQLPLSQQFIDGCVGTTVDSLMGWTLLAITGDASVTASITCKGLAKKIP
jgi:hypothetical protein